MGKEAEGVDTVETSRAFCRGRNWDVPHASAVCTTWLACNGTNIWEEHPNASMEPKYEFTIELAA